MPRSKRSRFLRASRKPFRCSMFRVIVASFAIATLVIVCFLGFLIHKFPPGVSSSVPAPPGIPSPVSVIESPRLPKLPKSPIIGSSKPKKPHGVELATGNVKEKRWPAQSVILYEKPGCKGEKYEVHNTHVENNCAKCFDVCQKKFSGSGREIQGHWRSLKVVGEGAIVSMWAICKGTWTYPGDEGYISSVQADEGCKDINKEWPPVHLQFHMKDESQISSAKSELEEETQYRKNPIKNTVEILEKISYWKEPDKPIKPATTEYVTFLKDCGGFNNIRMGFEHAILMAWATGRTLVLPPPEGWYLIDFGPIKRGGSYSKGMTDFSEYFDIDHLKRGMPVITAQEFYDREKDRLGLTAEPKSPSGFENRGKSPWKTMLWDKFNGQPWSPNKRVVLWPTIDEYMASSNKNDLLLQGKGKVEFSSDLLAKTVIHFPACHGPNGDQGIYRYLGQIANAVLFSKKQREIEFKRFWKMHIHYPKVVFEAAAKMIAKMGLFSYTAIHIRRNDLQYKEVFQNAQSTLRNIEPLLYPGEPLYLATDETNDAFFDAIRQKHKVYQWKDVVNEAKDIKYSDKVINILEQTICAGGRRFFGTQKSTFTSYIFRLRGYIGAPDTNEYWHNIRYTGMPSVDKFAKPKVTGHNYMMEDPGMWEDLK